MKNTARSRALVLRAREVAAAVEVGGCTVVTPDQAERAIAAPRFTAVAATASISGKAASAQAECEALVELARAADLLVLECSHDDAAKLPGHLSPPPCGRIAKQAGVGQLLLTHFYPGWAPESALSVVEGHYRGPVRLAVD